ncbi:MAG: D-alanine--D-alanine ligase [Pseudomonadota bacterium]
MNQQTRVAVLCGGPSAEAAVSRVSAQGVAEALRSENYQVEVIELDHNLHAKLLASGADVVFPALHGPPGEDGTLQGALEIFGLPYVGSGVMASAIAMNKIMAKLVFASWNLPLVEQLVVERENSIETAVSEILRGLGSYVVVKPSSQGSALGVTLVEDEAQLAQALSTAFELDRALLIEKRIDGREITVGVIDTADGPQAFPVIEITTPKDSWYDYEHRYTAGLFEHLMPADLPAAQYERLQQIAVTAHRALGCRDLSRADFVVAGDDEEYLLEVNTLPGMTPTSLYPDGARGYGLSFPALMRHFIERALLRKP